VISSVTNILCFNSPAAKWEEALPLGNGRLGAMIFGSPDRERIQLNEDSIWSGQFRDRNNPAAKEALAEIRRLLAEGRALEAEELCIECFSGTPMAQRVYQSAGDLLIDFSPKGGFGHRWSGIRGDPLLKDIRGYKRELDLARALHAVSFEYEGTVFKRECFISSPADLLVLYFSAAADGKPVRGQISFRAYLDRGVFCDRKGNCTTSLDSKDAAFIARDGDVPFCAMAKAVNKGGTLKSRGGFITVEKADEVLLFVDIRSGFREKDCEGACVANLNRAASENWEQLIEGHCSEYRAWYDRVKLKLDDDEKTERYFNFCRYLLISSSRPGTLPANLQGLWNPHLDPPWGCDYTININTQMNYWPACMCGLAETEEPLFDLLEKMYPNGKKTAKEMYGCRGFAAHHNTDIWGDTSPRDCWIPASYWALGAAWLSIHIWEHYEYTQDKKFLEKYFYLLKEACVFFIDFLVPGKKTNEEGEPYLIISPSSSPENSYLSGGTQACLCAGCEMDNQILRKLFSSALRAAEILDVQNFNAEEFRSILARLAAPAIHSNGTIREWNEEYEEAEPGHRHFSHLWALWPGDEINPDETPQLAIAARKTIERRLSANGGHTGWSRSWLINFMARLKDSEAALEHLNDLYKDFTLPNLLNSHPPFQIDGNFGSLAGIAQMFVQSRVRYKNGASLVSLDLLPALPQNWSSGSIKGLRAKGNLELDFDWRDGKIISLVIRNKSASAVTLRLRGTGEEWEIVLSGNAEESF